MIRLTPQYRFHVSNRTALLAALTLMITSYVGLYKTEAFDDEFAQQPVVASATADSQSAATTTSKRKLSISLLLFGRG